MECLGTIIKSGTRFTYYKDEQGGIWFDDEPVEGKPEWMLQAEKERRRRNRKETYICDEICFCNNMQMTQEERERYCNNCQIGKKVDEIEAEYEKINTFSKSAAYALMEKYRNIVLCKDCIYRAHEKTGYDWCRLAKGLDESLGESEGCSRGKEKE